MTGIFRTAMAAVTFGLLALAGISTPSNADGDLRVGRQVADAYRIDGLAFMAGRWEGTYRGADADEIWMPPRGKVMAGSYRIAPPEGDPQMIMMLIHERSDGVFLRFKPFDPDFVELRAEPAELKLTELGEGKAVFEPAAGSVMNLARLVYHRIGSNRMDIILEYAGEAAGEGPAVFHMTLGDRMASLARD